MKFLKRLRGTFLALLPILVVVFFVHFFFYKFETELLLKFVGAIVIAAIGEALLLMGIDSTIMPMGDLMVNSVTKASRFVVFLIFAMLFGTFATVAEPDVAIFSNQAVLAGATSSKTLLTFMIGAGLGILVAFGVLCIIKRINLKYIYLAIFSIIFLLCTQVPSEYIALAFDAGGATTGVISAPFLLAISSGISNKFSKKESNNSEVFGMVGIASLGPIISTLLLFAFVDKSAGVDAVVNNEIISIYLDVLSQTALAIVPLAVVFFIYDIIILKLPINQKISLIFGMVVTFVGLYLFLFSIEFGITNMGKQIGNFIETLNTASVVIFCVVIGFIITFSEPSVMVLAKQVQSATKGNISKGFVMIAVAISMSLAILVSIFRIIYNISFFNIILIGYLVALLLMFFVPSIFTGLAFDSGGVASGPMTSAFLLPIVLEFASLSSNPMAGFGLIGIVSMSPIIVLQLLGMVYKFELNQKDISDKKRAIKVSFTADMYSNIQSLENEYKLMCRKKGNEK